MKAFLSIVACLVSMFMLVSCGTGDTIYVAEDTGPFDAEHGDTVVVVMHSDGDSSTRCLNMGGVVVNKHDVEYCWRVDF